MDETTLLYTIVVFVMCVPGVVGKHKVLVQSAVKAFLSCWQSPSHAVSTCNGRHKPMNNPVCTLYSDFFKG